MIIYVVQAGDTITSIANKFGVLEARLVIENGIINPTDLVIGQTIVITNPKETYIVKAGDTLPEISLNHGISIMQLFQNNPYLWDRKYIYPGEELIIRYDTKGTISTSAYVFPFINMNILKKSLPYLTYLSIQNYKTLKKGEIETFYDDSELIQTAKQFGVMPIMLVSSITFQGERDPEMVYEILLEPDYQETHVQSMLKILKEKGYYGVNITITFLNKVNQELYLNYLKRVTAILHKEGYLVFITIDPNFIIEENQTIFEKVDYSKYNELIDEAYLMRFFWGTQYGPPAPVSSIKNISLYLDYVTQMMNPQKINIGFPLLGYDWTLPYIQGFSKANAITLDSAIELARTRKATILFDDVSETPYFEYTIGESERIEKHIVWFVDARTIYAIVNLALENKLQGTGLWNIMSYYPQLWLIIISNCEIKKLI
jgi:spore germination protein